MAAVIDRRYRKDELFRAQSQNCKENELQTCGRIIGSKNVKINVIVFPLILAIPIIWLYAEFKLGRRARIILGLISMLSSGFLIYAFCQVKPFYESHWHRNSIRDAERLLVQGQTNVVISAFETYSSISATDSTFRASEQMMHILERGQTN